MLAVILFSIDSQMVHNHSFPRTLGPTGPTGPTGPVGLELITQAYANANIDTQTIAVAETVVYTTITTVGMTFNDSDTFTIITGGIYALNFGEGTTENSTFGISIKGGLLLNQVQTQMSPGKLLFYLPV